MLTEELLERLLKAWRDLGAPIADALSPGRDVATFISDDGKVQVDLPTEVRLWWNWRDGPGDRSDSVQRDIGPVLQCMSSAESHHRWQRSMALARRAAERGEGPLSEPEYWWRPTWVPLADDGNGYIVADCELGAPDLAPIRRIEWGPELDELSRPRTESLGQLVEWWIEAMELGIWTFDSSARRWRHAPHDLVVEARFLGLV